jgi:hypothetical protein
MRNSDEILKKIRSNMEMTENKVDDHDSYLCEELGKWMDKYFDRIFYTENYYRFNLKTFQQDTGIKLPGSLLPKGFEKYLNIHGFDLIPVKYSDNPDGFSVRIE